MLNWRLDGLVGVEEMVKGCSSSEMCSERNVRKANCPGI
jgi:hypothetical protein